MTRQIAALAISLLATSCGGGNEWDYVEVDFAILSPAEGDLVAGELTVSARVEPATAADQVAFTVSRDGAPVLSLRDEDVPYETVVDTAALEDGPYSVVVRATKGGAVMGEGEVSVQVDNTPPELEIVSPEEGEVVFVEDAAVGFEIVTADASELASVEMTVEGAQIDTVTDLGDGSFAAVVEIVDFLGDEDRGPVEVALAVAVEDALGHSSSASTTVRVMRRQAWRAALPSGAVAGITASPDGTVVYAATEAGIVHALSASDGTELCRYEAESDGFRAPATSPDGSTVYVGTGNGLRAFSAAPACAHLWAVRTGEVAQGRPTVDPVGARVLFTTRAPALHSFSLDGTHQWTRSDLGLLRSAPVVVHSHGIVAVSSDDHFLYGVASDGQSIVWSAETGGPLEVSPALDGTTLYVGSNDFNVYAFDAGDGSRLWEAPFPTDRQVTTIPAVDDAGAVYVGSRDGTLYKLSADRALDWSYEVESGIDYSSPVVTADGALVLFGETGQTRSDGLIKGVLHAVDADSGQVAWTAFLDGSVSVAPELVGGLVVEGTSLGQVYAFFVDGDAALAGVGEGPTGEDPTCESLGGTCREEACVAPGEVLGSATCPAAGSRCCLPTGGGTTDCVPECLDDGTDVEGWYFPCTGLPARLEECTGCTAACLDGAFGSGWYSFCTFAMIAADDCS